MVWCISVCSYDVDVDLLFQENSSIGQKMFVLALYMIYVCGVTIEQLPVVIADCVLMSCCKLL